MFEIQGTSLARYNGKERIVTIPAGVTRIGDFCFLKCKVTDVVIPEGVTIIGEGAFAHCKDRKRIVFPTTLISIGMQAFYGCDSLTEVSFPCHVALSDDSFDRCKRLKRIINPPRY